MGDTLEIHTLGGLTIRLNGTPLSGFASRKVEALLVYLACTRRTHPREVLADLLWDDRSQQLAQGNLRVVLNSLRKHFYAFVTITRQTVAMNPAVPYWLDVAELHAALSTPDEQWHQPDHLSSAAVERLEKGLALYQGEFLSGFTVYDCQGFESWVVSERERLHHQVIEALDRVVNYHLEHAAYGTGIAQATKLLQLDPLREESHRQMMLLLARTGQRKAALDQYDSCKRLLVQELGAEPSTATTALYEKIRSGEIGSPAPVESPAAGSNATMQLSVLRGIKGYILQEPIGAGAFATVYSAFQPVVDRDVAIKVIRPEYANQPDFIRRFEAEAQMVAHLEHPYIVPLYDYWREPAGAYLVMRRLNRSLRTALTSAGRWSPEATAHLLDQIGAALTAAHRRGVIHRDLKPDNILLDEDDNAYLADFGIAKSREFNDDNDDGKVTGTLAYMAPEQFTADPVSPQTDIYSLGIIIYELLVGSNPFASILTLSTLINKHLKEPMPPLFAARPDLPLEVDTLIQRATAKDPTSRYPDALSLAMDFRRAIAKEDISTTRLDSGPLSTLVEKALTQITNPYKGLRAFQEADAADFFGREALVQHLLTHLADQQPYANFLAVVGPSGSGKSSLVRAGLIPALRCGSLPGSDQWFFADILPGTHPMEEIELKLLGIAGDQLGQQPPSLMPQLCEDTRGLLRAVRRILPDGKTLVLVIDQFEEVFTLVQDQAERSHFLQSLVAALTDPRSPLRVVIILRADFYDRPLMYPEFSQLMNHQTQVVTPLNPRELEQAIVAPATRVGVTLEPGLVTAIVSDINAQPGALPHLQYALTELFERRDGQTLTLAAYRETGGVLGALTRRADELYDNLDKSCQNIARQLFLRLVTLGEGGEITRRRVRRAELTSITDDTTSLNKVIDAYSHHRLLTFDRDPITRGPTVEVAHEALISTWKLLQDWIAASREELHIQRLLMTEAEEWANAQRDPDYLAVGARLAQFEALASAGTLALNEEEKAYLDASIAAREAERKQLEVRNEDRIEQAQRTARLAREALAAQHRSVNRLRYFAAALVVFLIVAVELWFIASTNYAQAESRRLAAEANTILKSGGDTELAALLSIHALKTSYTTEADIVLQQAANSDYGLRLFSGHAGSVTSVAFSPDGKLVVTGSADHTARLWDVQSGTEKRQFKGHTENVTSVALSPDGKLVVTGSADNTARLWDIQSGAEKVQFSGHTDSVTSVAFSPDGKLVVTGSADRTAGLWDVQTGTLVRQFTGHTDSIVSVAFSPNGQYVVTGSSRSISGSSDKTARLWDVKTGAELMKYVGHKGGVTSVAFSPNGQQVLTVSQDGTARLWDTLTGQEQRQFVGHTDYVYAAAFAPNGQYILTGSLDYTARLWDAQSGVELRRFTHTLQVDGVAFSPDSRYIVTASGDRTARLWDLQTNLYPHTFSGHTNWVESAAISSDGKLALTGSADHTAILWDASTGKLIRRFTGHTDSIFSVKFSPASDWVLTGSADQTARLWDTQTGSLKTVFKGHSDAVTSVAFSPRKDEVLTASSDGTARLWDFSGKLLQTFSGHTNEVLGVGFSPDGATVYTCSSDRTIRIWDVQSGAQKQVITDNASLGIYWIALLPDTDGGVKYILTGNKDNTARLWDGHTGSLVRTFAGHTDQLWGVTFSPDGKYVLTASQDKTARLWDTATGNLIRILGGHKDVVLDVSFSPDGKTILTASQDKTAALWDVDYHDLVRFVCARVLRDFNPEERAYYHIDSNAHTCP